MTKIIQKKISLFLLLLPYLLLSLIGVKTLNASFILNIPLQSAADRTIQLLPEPVNYQLALVKRPSVKGKESMIWLQKEKCRLLVNGYCKKYGMPEDILFFMLLFLYKNPTQYKKSVLPKDLSGRDLRNFVFTGCKFENVNLTAVNLDNAILENTTCHYKLAIPNTLEESASYLLKLRDLSKYLIAIHKFYPKLKNNHLKAVLLQIACGLSRVTLYSGTDFEIKMMYWSSEWLHFRLKEISMSEWENANSLDMLMMGELYMFCWKTDYPQDQVNIAEQAPHTHFNQYIEDFERGLFNYKCVSVYPEGAAWYKESIIKSIQELEQVYPNIQEEKFQKEACNIAHALSKSYQIQQLVFLNHYLYYQNRLLLLSNLAGVKLKNRVNFAIKDMQDKLAK